MSSLASDDRNVAETPEASLAASPGAHITNAWPSPVPELDELVPHLTAEEAAKKVDEL